MIKNTPSLFYVEIILLSAVLLVNEHCEEFEYVDYLLRYIAPPKSFLYIYK